MSSTTVVRQLFGAFDGFRRGDPCGSSAAFAAKVDWGDQPGDGGRMTFPMGFAYVEAYGAARSCLGARAGMYVPDGRRTPGLRRGVANLRRHREGSLSGPCRGPDAVGNQRLRRS